MLKQLLSICILATLLGGIRPACAQYGPASLLAGGTNNVPTNGVWFPSTTTRINLGAYNTVGLQFSFRTVAAVTTNSACVAFLRSVDGVTYQETNYCQDVFTVPLNGSSTNTWLTNVALPPLTLWRLWWVSNANVNAEATNCLTNLTIRYLLK